MAPGATGIVVALASEARALTTHTVRPERLTPLSAGAALYLSGMGPDAAQRAAHRLADAGAKALAVFGVAGALDARLRNGSLFCPDHVLDGRGHDYAASPSWRTSLQQRLATMPRPLYMSGSLLTVHEPLLTTSAKTAAHRQHEALAVDMESAAVAAVANERNLPFVVLRAIVDEVGDTIPTALNHSVDAWGRPRALGLIAALCRHPALLAELPRLYSRMQRATLALRAAAKATGPALGWSSS
ncbi:purine and other phosphorylase-like protein, family 1 [Dyella psychrodurans]|uniref:Purine and other phosphorylase-like protein, family 1 n=2 Tax=Dyella psychrodurans TaxID=1927960 RepID=A0A370X4P9_9GAMM|nr:purine and other phosphorylase-like protein, family 1 [Dyella psychrodurans]